MVIDFTKYFSMACFSTVWKFQNFSVIQILREINFVAHRSSITIVFAISGGLKFVNLVNFSLKKVQKSKSRASECVKMANSELVESQKIVFT